MRADFIFNIHIRGWQNYDISIYVRILRCPKYDILSNTTLDVYTFESYYWVSADQMPTVRVNLCAAPDSWLLWGPPVKLGGHVARVIVDYEKHHNSMKISGRHMKAFPNLRSSREREWKDEKMATKFNFDFSHIMQRIGNYLKKYSLAFRIVTYSRSST